MKNNFFILLLFLILFSNLCSCSSKNQQAQKLYLQALTEYKEQKLDSCLSFTEEAISCNRDFYQASLLKIKVLYFQDKNQQALQTVEKLLKKHPEFTEARLWKIRLLLQAEQFEKAGQALEKELSFNNSDWRVYYLYALLGQKMNNQNLRLSMEKHAEQQLMEGSKVYIDLAAFWLNLGLRDRSIEYLEKARNISKNPADVQAAINHIKNGDDIL